MRRREALRLLGATSGLALLSGCDGAPSADTSELVPITEPGTETRTRRRRTPESKCPGGVLLVYDHVIAGEPLTVELTIGSHPPQLKIEKPGTGLGASVPDRSSASLYESSHELAPGQTKYVHVHIADPGLYWMETRVERRGSVGASVSITADGVLRNAKTIRITKEGMSWGGGCERDATPQPVVTTTRKPNSTARFSDKSDEI